jgi:hypothetical protein
VGSPDPGLFKLMAIDSQSLLLEQDTSASLVLGAGVDRYA